MKCVRIFVLIVISISSSSLYGFQNEGAKLFEKVPASFSGVNFNNKLEDKKESNIMIYSNFYGGAGVGIGDVNNDGLADLFFAGNQVSDRLYLNKGDFKFKDISKSSGILQDNGWSSGVIMADVNQDGWLDIYVTRELYDDDPQLRKNLMYMNNGDGTFMELAEEYGVANTERTRHATFLDYDNDGDLDLFLLNQPPNPGDYSKYFKTELLLPEYAPKLYRNEGSSFTDVSAEAGFHLTGFPNSVTASDLNGDGWTDLFVANDFYVGDWQYMNNGDGTFTNVALENLAHTSFSSMGVDAADINNDGLLDIGVVDMVAEDNYRQKANMSGMNPKAFWKVVEDGGHHQYMFNMLHLNKGGAHFADIAQLAGIANTDWSWSVLMADFDNDGWKDIHITNGLMRDIRNKDASKTLPYYMQSAIQKYLEQNPNPENVGVWDIVDIKKALALVPSEKLSNYIFKNNGDLTFTNKVKEWGMEEKTFSNGSAYADLDNDGDLDLVVNNINDPASLYRNTTIERNDGNFIRVRLVNDAKGVTKDGVKIYVTYEGENQFQEITGVRGMYSTSEKIGHFGLGDHAKVDQIKVVWKDGKVNEFKAVASNQVLEARYSKAVTLALKEEVIPPLFVQTSDLITHAHRENDFDDYKIQVLLPHKMSNMGPHLSVGDVNGDGSDDLFIGGAATESGYLFLQREGELIKMEDSSLIEDAIHEDLGSLLFDADSDGDLDLYVVSGGNEFRPGSDKYFDRLYINEGNKWKNAIGALPEISSSGSVVKAEDIDSDGDLDLFVGGRHKVWSYPEPVSSYILRNDGGKFTDVTEQYAPGLMNIGMVNDAVWTDQNGDGTKDLVVVGEWMPITIFINRNGRLEKRKDISLASTAGWWFSIEAKDMDGDGDEDLIAGNLGLNYKYKASEDEPFSVYYYDFDENGKKDIVLTYYNFGIEYPVRGKQCSSEQVPEINEKFETYDLFAGSNVSEIYGKSELESSLHYDAYSFASSYLENKGNGSYQVKALPVEAQLSSVNAIITRDFNKDGNQDILLAGNLYASEVETARNDAGHGLLLTGDGKGGFVSVDRNQSGIFLPYDVKDMELLEAEGQIYLIVSCNNDKLKTYRLRN